MLVRFKTGCSVATAAIMSLALVWSAAVTAQTYHKGQHIEPAYEGWEQNADGTYNFLFGYHNENWEEELDIPVGENNQFSPGDADRGQPTHFLPRRNRFTFKVQVPADWGDKELAWTVTANGVTRTAYATLAKDYVVDSVVIASEQVRLSLAPIRRLLSALSVILCAMCVWVSRCCCARRCRMMVCPSPAMWAVSAALAAQPPNRLWLALCVLRIASL